MPKIQMSLRIITEIVLPGKPEYQSKAPVRPVFYHPGPTEILSYISPRFKIVDIFAVAG